jgi:hypothetical protein
MRTLTLLFFAVTTFLLGTVARALLSGVDDQAVRNLAGTTDVVAAWTPLLFLIAAMVAVSLDVAALVEPRLSEPHAEP